MERYQLTVAAKMLGVNPWTLRRWVYAGKAPSIKSASGRVFIPAWWVAEQTGAAPPSTNPRRAGYGRESSSENKAALASQKDGLPRFDVLLVEHKDRLTRFGFRWFEALSPFRVEVINLAENHVNNRMEDWVAILTAFSARLYGQRRGRYKNGLVFSDGQQVGQVLYGRIQSFARRQKNTHGELLALTGHALKNVDFSGIKTRVIEDLKGVKHNQRGTFSRVLNRRLSHGLYRASTALLERRCEELGVRLERKDPYKTSQYCRQCGTWDRRNRRGDRFLCVNRGHTDHADVNASKNLEFLGLAGVYGLRSLPSSKCQRLG